MSEVHALENRVTRLEDQITDGFLRIENLLRQEINDLKDEQLSDLRKQNERLSDDQRRLWDRLTEIERRENRRAGETGHANRILGGLGHFLTALTAAGLTWLATWFTGTGGNVPPHH
jgi:ferric-dicitrate binding protein FerR (iron transport regulator)